MVLALPLLFPQGIGPKIFTEGKSRAIPSTVIDPLKPEIFALEVNNGPVSLKRDCAIFEFGILNPIVRSWLVRFTVCFSEAGITIVRAPGQYFEAIFS